MFPYLPHQSWPRNLRPLRLLRRLPDRVTMEPSWSYHYFNPVFLAWNRFFSFSFFFFLWSSTRDKKPQLSTKLMNLTCPSFQLLFLRDCSEWSFSISLIFAASIFVANLWCTSASLLSFSCWSKVKKKQVLPQYRSRTGSHTKLTTIWKPLWCATSLGLLHWKQLLNANCGKHFFTPWEFYEMKKEVVYWPVNDSEPRI